MAHWLTNRGKNLLMQGAWDDDAGTIIQIGLLAGAVLPTGIDSELKIQDFSDVQTFLAVAGVDEPVGGWYSRKPLTRTNAAQDDANNRSNLVAADVVWTAAAAGETIYGAFWFDNTTPTNDLTRQLMGVITFTAVPLNGSDFTLDIADFVRAS